MLRRRTTSKYTDVEGKAFYLQRFMFPKVNCCPSGSCDRYLFGTRFVKEGQNQCIEHGNCTRKTISKRSAPKKPGLAYKRGTSIGSIKVHLQCQTSDNLPSKTQHNQMLILSSHSKVFRLKRVSKIK